MRSEDGEIAEMCCASCGTADVDNIKLKEYDVLDAACQKDHTSQQERDYESRAAEIHDDILFRQPESSHLGECPICLLPLSLDTKHAMMQSCCSKLICIGCFYASIRYEVVKMIKNKKRSCPFCRQPEPKSAVEIEHYKMKRRKANDPAAIQEAGKRCYHDGDYERAFEYFSKAIDIEAGDGDVEAEAHYCLSFMYRDGKGIGRDAQKRVYHLEEAAIGGHPKARHDLGVHEVYQGRIERAARHFIIAANLGHDASLKALRELRAAGEVGREDFVTAFRAYQAAVNATKSRQRAEVIAIGAMQIVAKAKSRSFRANSK
jgi:TPR repeat protein